MSNLDPVAEDPGHMLGDELACHWKVGGMFPHLCLALALKDADFN